METIILFAPLVGALLCGFGWRIIGETAAMWIATGLLFVSAILSWIVFLTFDGVTAADPDPALDRKRHALDRLGDPPRPADRDHADRGHHGLEPRAPLFLRLHGSRSAVARGRGLQAALLCLSVVLHLRDADAGDRRQPGADVLRLGRRGRRLLPADRLLLPQALGQCRRDQGLRGQPGRRFRLCARHLRAVLPDRFDQLRRHLRRRTRSGRNPADLPLDRMERGQPGGLPAVHRARWANRRSCSCTPGCRTRWKARRRSRR